tara:strand:- start:987 stop:1694 length:708 start_codon:yes stop_codon:yes gene_type:complete
MLYYKNIQSLIDEREKKEYSMLIQPENLIKDFIEKSNYFFFKSDVNKIKRLINYIMSINANNKYHPSMRAYISHPIRVASFYLELAKKPSLEYVFISLLHNFFEITSLKEKELVKNGFSEKTCKAIKILTINRQLQHKHSYLKDYYSKIEHFSKNLALIKCIDKLDNLLAIKVISSKTDRLNYIKVSEKYVYPIAQRISKELSIFFKKTIFYAYKENFDKSFKKKLEQFNEKQNH